MHHNYFSIVVLNLPFHALFLCIIGYRRAITKESYFFPYQNSSVNLNNVKNIFLELLLNKFYIKRMNKCSHFNRKFPKKFE